MLADITLYAYTHAAEENGLSLSRYPSIQKWSSRIEAVPGFRAMGYA
jgi:glutathione S-transferase